MIMPMISGNDLTSFCSLRPRIPVSLTSFACLVFLFHVNTPAAGSSTMSKMTGKNQIPVEDVIGLGEWVDTQNDVRDMQRLGKKQEFKVRTDV